MSLLLFLFHHLLRNFPTNENRSPIYPSFSDLSSYNAPLSFKTNSSKLVKSWRLYFIIYLFRIALITFQLIPLLLIMIEKLSFLVRKAVFHRSLVIVYCVSLCFIIKSLRGCNKVQLSLLPSPDKTILICQGPLSDLSLCLRFVCNINVFDFKEN